jgi:hypothetical protein
VSDETELSAAADLEVESDDDEEKNRLILEQLCKEVILFGENNLQSRLKIFYSGMASAGSNWWS